MRASALGRALAAGGLALLHAACGSGGPTAPPTVQRHLLTLVVFLDADGDGRLTDAERVRVPGVSLSVAGHSGVSATTSGLVRLAGVPEGSHDVVVGGPLPGFYRPGVPARVSVPAAAPVAVGVSLAVGANEPHVYMAFGDSITTGTGSSDGTGYRDLLAEALQAHFALARVVNEGISGTKSGEGRARIEDSLQRVRPGFSLILYGTNDWSIANCRDFFPCDTIENLREMVRAVRAVDGLPVLATIVPANPERRNGLPRNEWISRMNDLIRELARAEDALLVDLHAAFVDHGDLAGLFGDAVHPNDAGYRLMADTFFAALSLPRTSS